MSSAHLFRLIRRPPSVIYAASCLFSAVFGKAIHDQLREKVKVFALVLGDVCSTKDCRRKRVVRQENKVFDRLECAAMELRSLFLQPRRVSTHELIAVAYAQTTYKDFLPRMPVPADEPCIPECMISCTTSMNEDILVANLPATRNEIR